jgi:preprotein translocase subunit SecG
MKRIIFHFLFILITLFLNNCNSYNRAYDENIKEREEHERNSYPGCMYWNTCTNYNGSSGDNGQKSAN